MSLVLDNLKKLKKQEGSGTVPPGMINLAPKRKSNKPSKVLIVLLVFALIGFGLTFFLGSGTPAYKATAPITLNAPIKRNHAPVKQSAVPVKQPTAPKQTTKPAPVNISEADIQARIDAAVKKALQRTDEEMGKKIMSGRDANIQRAAVIGKLPKQAEPEQPAVQKTDSPEQKPVLLSSGQELSALKQSSGEAEQTNKPVLSDKQKKEYDKKIAYNTTLTMADRAYAAGNYVKAIDGYQSAMAKKATSATLLNLIKSKLSIGEVNAVSPLLSRYEYVLDAKSLSAIALSVSDAGYFTDAVRIIQDFTYSVENSSVLYYTAGQIYEKSGNLIGAEEAYKKASDELPAEGYYAYAYARALDLNEKYEKAVKIYSKIALMDTENSIKINAESRAQALSNYLKRLEEDKKAAKTSENSSPE